MTTLPEVVEDVLDLQGEIEGGDVVATFAAAASAGHAGSEATVPMKATKGRASYLGERSIGHLDPGSVSSALLLQAAADAASEVFAESSE